MVSWIVTALLRPEVLNAIGRIVERVIQGQNADQLALIRADLSSMESRLTGRIEAIEARVTALEQLTGQLPERPPFPPGERGGKPL